MSAGSPTIAAVTPLTAATAVVALDGMGMAASRSLVEGLFVVVGAVALLLSAALGAAAWVTALRMKINSSGGVFARGFLGVSAVVAFVFGVACVALGIGSSVSERWSSAAANGMLIAVLSVGVAFLAIEFAVAGTLYWRVGKTSGGAWPKALSISSYGLCAMLTLVSLLGLFAALGAWIAP